MTKCLRAEAPSAPAESGNPADPVRQREAAEALERRGDVRAWPGGLKEKLAADRAADAAAASSTLQPAGKRRAGLSACNAAAGSEAAWRAGWT